MKIQHLKKIQKVKAKNFSFDNFLFLIVKILKILNFTFASFRSVSLTTKNSFKK